MALVDGEVVKERRLAPVKLTGVRDFSEEDLKDLSREIKEINGEDVENQHDVYEAFVQDYEEFKKKGKVSFLLVNGREGAAFIGEWLRKSTLSIYKGGEVLPFDLSSL